MNRTRMVLVALATTVAVLASTACEPALVVGQPARSQPPSAPQVWDNSDPFVLRDGAQLYLFGSTNNKQVPVRAITSFAGTMASSRQEWDALAGNPSRGDAMPTRPAWVNPASDDIWAPSVIKLGTRYVLYFAAHRTGATDAWNDQCIGRASASTPMGPYVPESAPIYCGRPLSTRINAWGHGALDPEVIRGQDGKLYLLVALSLSIHNIGVLDLTSTGAVVGGINAQPTTLVSQSSKSFSRNGFLENPSMIYDPASKTYLLFYSAGDWRTNAYATGFGRCRTPKGPCVVDTAAPFLTSGRGRSGPGGLTAFLDAEGRPRVAYATWQAGFQNQPPAVNTDGRYSRQVSWGELVISGSDPATQSVRLQWPTSRPPTAAGR